MRSERNLHTGSWLKDERLFKLKACLSENQTDSTTHSTYLVLAKSKQSKLDMKTVCKWYTPPQPQMKKLNSLPPQHSYGSTLSVCTVGKISVITGSQGAECVGRSFITTVRIQTPPINLNMPQTLLNILDPWIWLDLLVPWGLPWAFQNKSLCPWLISDWDDLTESQRLKLGGSGDWR